MQKWQYETFAFTNISGSVLKAKLNELGQDGWEYCGASAFPIREVAPPTVEGGEPTVIEGMIYNYLFKRPEELVISGKDIERYPAGHALAGTPKFINGG